MATVPTNPTPAAPTAADVAAALQQLFPKGSAAVSVTTDIGALANLGSKMLDFAMTPTGQQLVQMWIKDAGTVQGWIGKAATSVDSWFKGFLKK